MEEPIIEANPLNESEKPKVTPKILFEIVLKKKGRVKGTLFSQIKKDKKFHSKSKKDNIFRKIKVKFHQFLLELINKIIKQEFIGKFTKFKIKKGMRQITQDISISFNQSLFSKKISEFLGSGISQKYKKGNCNQEKIHLIFARRKPINKLLDATYIDVYRELFVKANPIPEILAPEYEECLKSSMHLSSVLEGMKRDEGEEEDKYIEKFKRYAENEFENYFANQKGRKSRMKEEKTYLFNE